MKDFIIRHINTLLFHVASILIFGSVVMLTQATIANKEAVDTIKAERTDRIALQDATNKYICNSDNAQDAILAGLIRVSITKPNGEVYSVQEFPGVTVFTDALRMLNDRNECIDVLEGTN